MQSAEPAETERCRYQPRVRCHGAARIAAEPAGRGVRAGRTARCDDGLHFQRQQHLEPTERERRTETKR